MSLSTVTGQRSGLGARAVVRSDSLAAIGGLVFASALLAQNIIRASGPGFDAAPGQVVDYFLHHPAAALVPVGMFPVEMIAFFAFVAGVWTKADSEQGKWWASMGALGTATIAALFAFVNITEIVLTAKAGQLASSPTVVQALWAVHGAAFGLDLAAIAVALIGLSHAAASLQVAPAWLTIVAWPASASLLVAATFTVALTNGGPWLAVGLPGFIVWLIFVITASLSLLRSRRIP
jgi:hypothetical protein